MKKKEKAKEKSGKKKNELNLCLGDVFTDYDYNNESFDILVKNNMYFSFHSQ